MAASWCGNGWRGAHATNWRISTGADNRGGAALRQELASDTGAGGRASQEGDLHRIQVGEERYELPDAVVLGG